MWTIFNCFFSENLTKKFVAWSKILKLNHSHENRPKNVFIVYFRVLILIANKKPTTLDQVYCDHFGPDLN